MDEFTFVDGICDVFAAFMDRHGYAPERLVLDGDSWARLHQTMPFNPAGMLWGMKIEVTAFDGMSGVEGRDYEYNVLRRMPIPSSHIVNNQR